MKVYTRKGDKGTTSLVYGKRVSKSDARVEAYGTCDEANSTIGHALSFLNNVEWEKKDEFLKIMHRVQTILFHVGAELSTPSDKEVRWKLTEAHITELESQIDAWDAELPILRQFILPSGNETSSALQISRTVVRRAERRATEIQDELQSTLPISYLNRLSDFLFVAARYVNKELDGEETPLQVDV